MHHGHAYYRNKYQSLMNDSPLGTSTIVGMAGTLLAAVWSLFNLVSVNLRHSVLFGQLIAAAEAIPWYAPLILAVSSIIIPIGQTWAAKRTEASKLKEDLEAEKAKHERELMATRERLERARDFAIEDREKYRVRVRRLEKKLGIDPDSDDEMPATKAKP